VLMMLVSDKDQSKENIEQIFFRLHLKLASVSADLTDSSRLFHTVGPATKKARSPNLVLVRGTRWESSGENELRNVPSHTVSQRYTRFQFSCPRTSNFRIYIFIFLFTRKFPRLIICNSNANSANTQHNGLNSSVYCTV